MTPFLFLLAGSFAVHLFNQVKKSGTKRSKQWGTAAVGVLLLASFILPAAGTITETIRLASCTDCRETSRIWIAENLPAGSCIAIESYSPYIEPECFQVQGVRRMIDNPAVWYEENGFDYLVCSGGMYSRFFDDPVRYCNECEQYELLFSAYTLDTLFSHDSPEIRVYSIH